MAMAALASANASPVKASLGDSPSAYIWDQRSATAWPFSSSKVAFSSSTSAVPPVCAAYSG